MSVAINASVVTEPGVYDLPPDVYHADPTPDGSLSVSGARLLLPPSCPAKYAWQRNHPQQPTPEFDIGHAAHTLGLGVGPDLLLVDAKDWRTKAAQAQRDEARANGYVPLLKADYEAVNGMATVLRDNPHVGPLFGGAGLAEKSLFWIDEETGIWCRARPDWMPYMGRDERRAIIIDYKTSKSAYPGLFGKAADEYGYHMQAAWYMDGVKALGLADDVAFVFVVQEKTPPYLVSVDELDAPSLRVGADRNRKARQIYRDCTDSGVWPGYSQDVELVSLPPWALRRHEQETW